MERDRPGPLRVAFHTQGCRLNQYDTEVLKDAMARWRPVVEVSWHEAADVYVLNSCTVTGKAAQACRRLARQAKAAHPQARVVVAGCYAQTQPSELAAMPEVDAVVGNTLKTQIDRWLPELLAGDGQVVQVEPFGARQPFTDPPVARFSSRTRAYVKIQDGCDLRCSYCQIWQARGPARSRPLRDVLVEITRLHHEAGYRELVLTGVHLGDWGRDLAEGPASLADLLVAICRALPAAQIRLASLHPDELSPVLVDLIASQPQLAPHVHLSLQSGSDTVLQRMRRPYRSRQVAAAAASLARIDPSCGLGADLIAGFPGETDDEFAETVSLVESLPFSYLHVFRFSPRPGTPAAAMAPVPPAVVSARAEALRALGRRKQEAFAHGLIGKTRRGILERPDRDHARWRRVTLDNYAAVRVASDLPAGTLVAVRPTAWTPSGLCGDLERVVAEVDA